MSRDKYESLFYKALGEVLVGMRQKQGRSYRDVAYVIGENPMTFYKWENGSRKIPLPVLKKLCIYYNVSIDKVIDKVNEKVKKEL